MSLVNNSYDVYIASSDFMTGGWIDTTAFGTPSEYLPGSERNITFKQPNWTNGAGDELLFTYGLSFLSNPYEIQPKARNLHQNDNGSFFERLENTECMEEYAKTPLPGRRTLLLISSTSSLENDNDNLLPSALNGSTHNINTTCTNSTGHSFNLLGIGAVSCAANSSLYSIVRYDGRLLPVQAPDISNWFNWMCSQETQYDSYDASRLPSPDQLCGEGYWQSINASRWTVWGYDVDYCISENINDACQLNVARSLLIVVIIFNALVSD